MISPKKENAVVLQNNKTIIFFQLILSSDNNGQVGKGIQTANQETKRD